jgi:hypothetical protein
VLAELHSERDRALIRGFYVDGQTKPALMLAWNLDKDHFDKVLSRARLRMRELMHEKLASKAGAVSGVTGLHLVSKHGAA